METLISSYEVVKYSFAEREYSTQHICNLIKHVEKSVFSNCLGDDFYDMLISNSTKYDKAELWSKKKTYSQGDIVIYCGCFFESLINSNNEIPETENWFEPVKFENSCYQKLWECFLREILAQSIYKESIPFETMKGSAKGLMVFAPDDTGATTASMTNIRFVMDRITKLVDESTNLMVKWINSQHELWECGQNQIPKVEQGCNFSMVKFIKDKCNPCTINNKAKRRISWAF